MKHGLSDSAHPVEEAEATKYLKVDGALDLQDDSVIEPYLKDFEEIQSELQKLDEDCAREQMIIQNKFDEKKKPWFEKRQGIIDCIPGFWCRTLRRHPILAYIIPEDIEILNFLRRIDLEDNIDDSGSYKISFAFNDKAKEFFEPLVIVKHVKFESDKEQVEECTEIKWKAGKNPVEKALERRKADGNCDDWSIFEWFTKQSEDDRNEDRIDIGEVIRRDIWHSPLPHFLGTALADYEDGDFEDDDQDYDEDEVDDEDEEDADDDDGEDNVDGEENE